MIYDCILFNGEWECLEMRCEELKGLNVRHILVEADYTFTGKPKEFNVWSDRMAELQTKYPIQISVSMSRYGRYENPWDNETYLRNRIKSHLIANPMHDDDVVIIADADEIHRRSVIEAYKPEEGFKALVTDKYGYYINLLEGKQTWKLSRIMPWSYLKDTTPNEVRNSGFPGEISNAGWHFSWLGGVDKMLEKFASFSHQEPEVQKFANKELLEKKLEKGESLWSDDNWQIVGIDETYPIAVKNNIEKYKHLIK